jgi:DNA helicase-2/ATP-dependent DNA helicase PcrA
VGRPREHHDTYRKAEKVDAELEERRLAYVACTRAERRLYVSGHWWGPTQVKPRGPSSYLRTALAFCASPAHPQASVAVEVPDVADGMPNPCVVDGLPVPWPAALDPDALAGRRAVAADVRARIDVLRATGSSRPTVPDDLSSDDAALVASWDRDAEALLVEARALLDPAAQEVPVPSSLAATTALRLFRDPAAVTAELIRPMPRPPSPAATRGTRFHTWVEEHFAQGQLELADLLESRGPDDPLRAGADLDDVTADVGEGAAVSVAGGVLGDLGPLGGADDPDLDELVTAFLAGPFADRRPHAVEAPFAVVLGGLVVRGRIDAVYADRTAADPTEGADGQGGWLVVDWKTGTRAPDPWQLAVYRLAWAELQGVDVSRVRAAFYTVPTGTVDEPGELPDRAALEAHVAALRG